MRLTWLFTFDFCKKKKNATFVWLYVPRGSRCDEGKQFAFTEVQTHLKHEPLIDNDMPWLGLKAAMLSSDLTSSLAISNI